MPYSSQPYEPLQILDPTGNLVGDSPLPTDRIAETYAAMVEGRTGDERGGRARELPLSLSNDHRAIDGATDRAFPGSLVEALEEQA